MNNLFAMDELYSSQGLIEYVECLFDREYFVIKFALDCVKIAHITVLHDQKVPITVYVMMGVPSKVLKSLTILGCYKAAMVLISWMRLFLSCGSLIIFFLERHLMAQKVEEDVAFVASKTCPKPPFPIFLTQLNWLEFRMFRVCNSWLLSSII